MELDALISEICKRVEARIAALEQNEAPEAARSESASCDKPKLLLIAREHGENCHATLEDKDLAECYDVDCILSKDGSYDMAEYEGVMAFNLTNDALGKVAGGIFDTEYTKAFGKALLLGKKIFVPKEEVELFQYKGIAPVGYYNRLLGNLKFLEGLGVTVVPQEELVQTVLRGKPRCKAEENSACAASCAPDKSVKIAKKVLTERDMIAACEEGAVCVCVSKKTIVTDLAKDYGRRHGVEIAREE